MAFALERKLPVESRIRKETDISQFKMIAKTDPIEARILNASSRMEAGKSIIGLTN